MDEDIIFNLNNKNSTLNYDKDWDAWITVTAQNEQPIGSLVLDKDVLLKDDVNKSLIKKDIDYTKIAFDFVAKENILDYADGSIIYKKGDVIGKYYLNADSTLTIDNIRMGKYFLKECETIDGVVLDNKEYEVNFTQTDTTTKKYKVNLKIDNYTTCVEISKTDITGEKELPGAKLKVTDEEHNVIDSWTSTDKSHKIEGLKVGKKYMLTEEIGPERICKSNIYRIYSTK